MTEESLVVSNVLFDANMSPAGFRSRLALRLAGIRYVRVAMDLALFDQKSELYRKLNPTGLAPTLMLGKEIIYDSHAIVDRVLRKSSAKVLMHYNCAGFTPATLQNLERVIAQKIRPAVYELVGPRRLTSRFASWEEARKALEERGVAERYREFAYELFHKTPGMSVVSSVIAELEPLLEAVRPLIEQTSRPNAQHGLDYFDICLAPRLNAVRLLGLDPDNILGAYLDGLNAGELWGEISGQDYDMEFTEYKEKY